MKLIATGTVEPYYVNEELLNELAASAQPESNGLTALLDDVRTFHHACDQPVLDAPMFPDQKRIDLRHDLIEEEFIEFVEGLERRDLVAVADALGDIIYVVVGTALEFGIPLDRVWDEIQHSNMLKVDPATGKARKFPNGKIMKPENWEPPNIARALGALSMSTG